MAVTGIAHNTAKVVVAARSTAGSAPDESTDGFRAASDGGRVRLFFDYTGTVSACNVRLYTREPGGTAWYRGVSANESGFPLGGSSAGDESRDLDVGENVEFTVVVESISGGGTVAVKAAGVSR